MSRNFFPDNFWDYAWTKFFDNFSQEEFDKKCPPDTDLKLDDKGNFITTDGIPGIKWRLTQAMKRPPGPKTSFSLVKSKFIDSILKRHDIRAWLQNALELVYFEHQKKKDSGMQEIAVPAILLAALIQRVQETETWGKQFGDELGKVREAMDEHTAPGVHKDSLPRPVIHVDLNAAEEHTLMDALKKAEEEGRIKLVEIDDPSKPPPLFELLRIETGRMSSKHPNLCGCQVQHGSSDMGRSTSTKPNCEEIDGKEEE